MRTCVIMSTYNSEKYIHEQLDSIFQQKNCGEIMLYVRDDGSKNNTVGIIKEYAKKNNVIIIVDQATNQGASKSFLLALRECPDADFYAFCDQDDVWVDGKLNKAIDILSCASKPMLWISNYTVVDSNLNVLVDRAIDEPLLSPEGVLFHNNVPGCVMVFNRNLLYEMRKFQIDEIRMHDIMALNIALITGNVYFESDSFLKYRQHNSNVIGYGHKKIELKKWIYEKIHLLIHKERYNTSEYAKEILQLYEKKLTYYQKKEFTLIAKFKNSIIARLILISRPYVRNNEIRSDLSIMCKILFGIM